MESAAPAGTHASHEHQAIPQKEPHPTHLHLKPFTFHETLPFFIKYAPIDKALLYGMTGGVPMYLEKIDTTKNVYENARAMFLSENAYFLEEPVNIINRSLREPALYNAILEAIACGAARLNEIAESTRLESNKCAKYILTLIAMGLIKKELPFGKASVKRSIYRVNDCLLRFWYRFVFPNMSAIMAGKGADVLNTGLEPQLNVYMEDVFESICRQWLTVQAKQDALPFPAERLARWWGVNPINRSRETIDIMAARRGEALFAQCCWSNADVGLETLRELRRKSDMFEFKRVYLYIFTKRMFTRELLRAAQDDSHLCLVTLSQICSAVDNSETGAQQAALLQGFVTDTQYD
jgi:hypothetical protein